MNTDKTQNKPVKKAPTNIKVCHGHACCKNFSNYTFDRALDELKIDNPEGGTNPSGKVSLEKSACQGRCKDGPTVVIERGNKQVHTRVNSLEMGKILKTIKK